MQIHENVITIDVEDWYHILDSSVVPQISRWGSLESRVARNVERLLKMLEQTNVQATFFWLGWVAERHKSLVRMCQDAGHEIASHGYAHVLPYKVGRNAFREDAYHAKGILEDITGQAVLGFRAAGFGVTHEARWAFDVIKEVGYAYDSSVFPATRGHGGMPESPMGPYVIETQVGPLLECPMSAVEVLGARLNLFGGGYLRIAPKHLIRWGCDRLHADGQPVIVYVHPREIDPSHPRLPLSLKRRFKCYVNLKSTMAKLEWLCREYKFCTMRDLADRLIETQEHIATIDTFSSGSPPVKP